MRATDAPEGADMVILNTCHIREKAAEKVYSELGRLQELKAEKAQAGGRMLLAVAGCVAQAEGAEIVARQPAVDLVVGPQSYHRLPEMIARTARAERPCAGNRFSGAGKIRFPAGAGSQRRQRLPHRAGRLRQVLHLLRGALYARLRTFAPARSDPARGAAAGGQGRARDRAAGPERQCL